MESSKIKSVHDNIYNFIWFKLSRYFNKHYENYTVNKEVYYIYEHQKSIDHRERRQMQKMAEEIYDQGYPKIVSVLEMVKDRQTSESTFMKLLYISLQVCKIYLGRGEIFAVKNVIFELQTQMCKRLQVKDA